ncbi:MAG: Alpha-D-ribose 1-methylphosphonate 5-triphosphate diphosphatase [Rhodospirillales bacterium]|nr:Alpha-D-ribose 1-methylphosphonate 5-triphosphate diphosphatase [Rhodospirillales bacterium]
MAWNIEGGRVLRGTSLEEGDLCLAKGRIAGPTPGTRHLDARGLLVMPGLVDIHGDAHERQLEPRPGIGFAAPLALRDSAAQILAAGITTAYLGVTLSWEPGLRSIAAWRALRSALETLAAGPDLRVHLRFEADNFDSIDEALEDIAAGRIHLLGFNDHTPGILKKLGDDTQAAKYAARAGMTLAAFRTLVEGVAARRDEVPAARARMARAAQAVGVTMLSHDDATIESRVAFRALGAHIAEFPLSEAIAEDARDARESVVMGAPNVVRGGSHLGWASAAPLAERGLVTILASDYYWPAMMEAAFVLETRGKLALGEAWALVSANPARALGLTDRGAIEPGLRGDIVLVDAALRAPVASFVAGELAWLSTAGAARIA